MKYALGSLLFAGALALSFGAARADVLVLTSSALKDNDQLPVVNRRREDPLRSTSSIVSCFFVRSYSLVVSRLKTHWLMNPTCFATGSRPICNLLVGKSGSG